MRTTTPRSVLSLLVSIAFASMPIACGGGGGGGSLPSNAEQRNGNAFAVTQTNDLIQFTVDVPGEIRARKSITGVHQGEQIVAIDFQPSTGTLFAVGNANRLYTIDRTSGKALQVGSGTFNTSLAGTLFDADFDPVSGFLRVTSNTGQNLRLDPDTGKVAAAESSLMFDAADPNAGNTADVRAIAYTNAFQGATQSTLFAINGTGLVVQVGGPNGTPPPSTGTVHTVGPTGQGTLTGAVGFDILGGTTLALAAIPALAGGYELETLDLTTGDATLVGAIGGSEPLRSMALEPPMVFAIDADRRLATFVSTNPTKLVTSRLIAGLQPSEQLVGIDFRPATGQLYGVGNTSRLYRINTTTAVATLVGTGPFTPVLSGSSFGVDFNPAADALRVVSDTGQNLRIHPDDGTVILADTALDYDAADPNSSATPQIVASAYTSNFAGAASTTLYGIDAGLDVLATQGGPAGTPSPNGGLLFTVGALGTDASGVCGFDVASNRVAYAVMTAPAGTQSGLFAINLATGDAQPTGLVQTNFTAVDIAIPTPAPPVAFGVTAANHLVTFQTITPGTFGKNTPLDGLPAGETIVGIDFRPSNGQLYAVGGNSFLYRIDTKTAGTVAVGTTPFTPVLAGTAFAVDFDSVTDVLRVISDSGQNLRIDPDLGTVIGTDTSLAFDAGDPNSAFSPSVVGAAYTSSFVGAPSTTLFGIDSGVDSLVRIGGVNGTPSPNAGTVFTVGSLGTGVDATSVVAFDVTPTGAGFATIVPAGSSTSSFYRINLSTGAAKLIGAVSGTSPIVGLAMQLSSP